MVVDAIGKQGRAYIEQTSVECAPLPLLPEALTLASEGEKVPMAYRIAAMILLDQLLKLVVYSHFMSVDIDLFPGVLGISPRFNRGGSYLASLSGLDIGRFVTLSVRVLAAFVSAYLCRYIFALQREDRLVKAIHPVALRLFATAWTAGIACSMIDLIFWGTSLDYIALRSWFVFDLKDLYLTVGEACFAVIVYNYCDNRITKLLRLGLRREDYRHAGDFLAYVADDMRRVFGQLRR